MKRQLVVYLVSLAAFLGPFPQTIYTPILPEVRAAFATSSFLINLTILIFTFFLAASIATLCGIKTRAPVTRFLKLLFSSISSMSHKRSGR
ncbi:hypothetical protein B9L21_01390 [Geobacillus uzenensis]|uniref:Uncharacterized protein n=1 Tax=Geobacillus uzenensis TaxID=129339 RepID=A0ABX4DLV4_9BACL|nr:hypothetical protein B9L21_01390 [Geobacillus uzenensis]